MGSYSWLLVCFLGCVSLSRPVFSRGAGRAFPVESENYIISNFQQINPSLQWDETNFLVDLSGFYANCDVLKQPRGTVNVDRKTREGEFIGGFVDSIEGKETHVGATTAYITELIKRWNSGQQHYDTIRRASKFGCSVRPGCSGYAVVACLFGFPHDGNTKTTPRPLPTVRPTTPRQTTTTIRTFPSTPERLVRTERPLFTGDIRALAFTKEQYKVAEGIIGRTWDPSHYLENLSGYETDCSMIGTSSWPFEHTEKFNRFYGSKVKGLYGYTLNRGSTPDALQQILPRFSSTIQQANLKDLGCSLIPDCIQDGAMYVVVSCLYEI